MQKILLVEDDLPVRELYKRVLERADYEVIEAVDGEDGFKKAKMESNLSLILLDIRLPKLNGIDLLKMLKEDLDTKNVPVILLTNLGQESIIQEAFRLGAEGYLIKVRMKPKDVVTEVQTFLKGKI
ncbi:hypothetical protein A2982_01880 [candidate division WWE3 bacterium RIFCSPLOWO2_01_FULL_39_13]|uniref:Response regulatory domain-containing protein n=1 Tax=candidate division WWE3 bacterium RIFCSPLOWO2_01_FULL_39_13 TaxID=1802624 RepID=A0A1F4V545_UNCKA|nr:MAG: hypothetical protein A2982_01880 [candidate division WWE3 bacterium RIFCSPLOWO2_01_FULL_39_13]